MENKLEDYCSFEVAKLLKENGFNSRCHATYDTAVTGGKPRFSEYEVLSYFPYGMKNTDDKYNMVISAPTHQMAMKWLRDVHNLHIGIVKGPKGYHITIETIPLGVVKYITREIVGTTYVDSYEEAVEAALKYSLENLI